MLSKQDELLEKLQKCVGRLQGRPSATDRYPPREQPRHSHVELSNQKPVREKKYEAAGYGVENRREGLNVSSQYRGVGGGGNGNGSGIGKWGNDQENYGVGDGQLKSARHSLSKNYLTERRYPGNHDPAADEGKAQAGDLRKKYEESQKVPGYGYEPPKRNNYMENSESARKPLRQYELNIAVAGSAKKGLEPKGPRSYLQEENYKKYEISSPKYEQYKPAEEKAQPYRRNSISYNESYNRPGREGSNIKNIDSTLNSNTENYRGKEYKPTARQVQPFSDYPYPNPPAPQARQPRERSQNKENLHSSSISRQISSQSKARQGGIGSISSVTKRTQLESSKVSYQTFQAREVRDPREPRELNLQKILDEVGSANQDTFTKLQKISELNDRINMRIKNIIDTFQAK